MEAIGDARLGRIGRRLDVMEEGRGVRPHRPQLASRVATDPQTPVGRQSCGRNPLARRRLAGSGEGFGRFRRAEAARRKERVAVGHLQLRQSLPTRRAGLGFVGLRQRVKQRLRLGDLGKLRRRRKPFQRGLEHGVRVDVAARRAIELCEGERGAQFEATCLLRPRDGDGGAEGGFGQGGVGGVVLEEDLAARAMEFGVVSALPVLIGFGERLIERCDSRRNLTSAGT